MKVLFLLRSLYYGGAERQLILLSKGLRERGHDVVVAVFYSGGPLEKELAQARVPLRSLKKRGRWDTLGFLARLIRLVREERPDVLHSYLDDPNLVALALKPLFPTTVIVWGVRTSVLDFSHYDWLTRLSFKLNSRLSSFPHGIIVNSHVGREYHISLGYPSDKMVAIPNGIDTNRFRLDPEARLRRRQEWGIAQHEKLVGLVGRLDPIKGHSVFLETAAALWNVRKDVRFVCVGADKDSYRPKLQMCGKNLGLEECLLWVDKQEDMTAVYSALDVAVSSSYGEGFSNVIAEAMACGLPCAVTDVGDSARIVADKGEVVPAGDPPALAQAVARLLDGNTHPRDEIRRQITEHLSVSEMVRSTERILVGLVSGMIPTESAALVKDAGTRKGLL